MLERFLGWFLNNFDATRFMIYLGAMIAILTVKLLFGAPIIEVVY